MDDSSEGRTYSERYKVFDYPHLAIIDPRTGRSLWKREGWTQEKPFTAEQFAEMAMDFCSRHSFDKEPLAPSKKSAAAASASPVSGNGERKRPFMSEEEQLQAAMAASLKPGAVASSIPDNNDDDEYEMEEDDDDDNEVECLGVRDEMVTTEQEHAEEQKAPSFADSLLTITVGDEPAVGARIQLRMPDATRLVRKFAKSDPVKTIYGFVAVSNFDCKLFLDEHIIFANLHVSAKQRRGEGRKRVHTDGWFPTKKPCWGYREHYRVLRSKWSSSICSMEGLMTESATKKCLMLDLHSASTSDYKIGLLVNCLFAGMEL